LNGLRLLVTGGAGFIGSNFIHYMLKKYPTYQIINVDKLTYAGNLNNLKDIEDDPRYMFIQKDINFIYELFLPWYPDWVINFAAHSHVDRSINESSVFVRSNYVGVQEILDWVLARKSEGKLVKILQIGTDEVYGDVTRGSSREFDLLIPSSPYSATKAAADLLTQAYGRTHGIPYVISRSSNNYGPYQYPEKLIPLAITNILQGKKVPIYGDGKQERDWIFVEDNCRALDLLIHKGMLGQIYNIGTEKLVNNLTIIQEIIRIMGQGEIEYVKDRPGHDRRYCINCEKLASLENRKMLLLKEGLKKTVRWYIENEKWWRRLI